MTALHYAVFKNIKIIQENVEVTLLILDKGASLSKEDNDEVTPRDLLNKRMESQLKKYL